MSSLKQHRFPLFILVFVSFVVVSGLSLLAVEQFSGRTYFVTCFVGFLVISEVFTPAEPEKRWWRRLLWIKLVGWAVFLFIIYERVVAVL